MFSIAKLDSVTLALVKAGVSNPAFGAWETLRSPLVDTWSAVKDAFTSAVNNITGKTTAADHGGGQAGGHRRLQAAAFAADGPVDRPDLRRAGGQYPLRQC